MDGKVVVVPDRPAGAGAGPSGSGANPRRVATLFDSPGGPARGGGGIGGGTGIGGGGGHSSFHPSTAAGVGGQATAAVSSTSTGIAALDSLASACGCAGKTFATPSVPFVGLRKQALIPLVYLYVVAGLVLLSLLAGWGMEGRIVLAAVLAFAACAHARNAADLPGTAGGGGGWGGR